MGHIQNSVAAKTYLGESTLDYAVLRLKNSSLDLTKYVLERQWKLASLKIFVFSKEIHCGPRLKREKREEL